jgi:hypothetical protein
LERGRQRQPRPIRVLETTLRAGFSLRLREYLEAIFLKSEGAALRTREYLDGKKEGNRFKLGLK